MGADIYLHSKFDKNYEDVYEEIEQVQLLFNMTYNSSILDLPEGQQDKFQEMLSPLFEKAYSVGYFRDPYNNNSLFWQLGLSWWKDVVPKLDDGFLSIENCKWLLDEIQNRRIGEQVSEEDPPISNLQKILGSEPEKKELNSEFLDYLINQKIQLCNLLKDAIELNEPLYCDL